MDFPSGSDHKESACNTGEPGLIPGSEDALEKGMVTHSIILALTEEPGGLQSMGLQGVRHDWTTNISTIKSLSNKLIVKIS